MLRIRATLMVSIFVVTTVSFFSFGIGAISVSAAEDPLIGEQWGLFAIGAPQVWSQSTGVGVIVAIVDGGSGPHPDLDANLNPGQSIIDGNRTAGGDDSSGGKGHGTHVAGIVAAVNGNGIGISGVAPNARLLPIRVFPVGSDSQSNSSDVALAIRFAVDAGVKVINLSLGGPTRHQGTVDAIAYAVGKNVLVVASAGNDGTSASPKWPSADDNTIAVTATDRNNIVASFGQRGEYIDLSAPGLDILSTNPTNDPNCSKAPIVGYCSGHGTSYAAPFVSGAAALLFSARPNITAAQVRFLLLSTATDLGDPGKDTTFGVGLLNLPAAFAALNIMFPVVTDPVISSTGRVNSVATGATPTKTDSPQLQWYRCANAGAVATAIPDDCAAINNAVAITYQLTVKDLRKFLRFAVTTTTTGAKSKTLSATSPKVIGVWLKPTTLQRGATYKFGQLIGSPSKGVRSVKVLSGACVVRISALLVATQATQCKIKVTISAKAPFPQLAFTSLINIST